MGGHFLCLGTAVVQLWPSVSWLIGDKHLSENPTHSVSLWLKKELNFFLQHDSKNCLFCNMTRRIEPCFLNMSQRIELFLDFDHRIELFSQKCYLQKLNLLKIWLKELVFFFQYNSQKESNLFLLNTTQRIEPFCFEYESKNWTLVFLNMTQRIDHFFFWKKTQSINWSFENFDSKNWTFFWRWLTEMYLIWIWLKEMIFYYDSKIWIFFRKMSRRIGLFLYDSHNWTFLFFPFWPNDQAISTRKVDEVSSSTVLVNPMKKSTVV